MERQTLKWFSFVLRCGYIGFVGKYTVEGEKAAASLALHCSRLFAEKMNSPCDAVFSSSISAAQVLQFLIAHSDTIQAILRCQDVSAGSLQELALLTGIISKAALPGELMVLNPINSLQADTGLTEGGFYD